MFRRFIDWLWVRWGTPVPPLPPLHRRIYDAMLHHAEARSLVLEMDLKDASGEYKRHAVYAELIKRHPGISRRVLALSIELAMEDMA